MKNAFSLIDKPTFFGAIALLLSIVFPLILFPAEGAQWIAVAKTFMTDKLGFLYLALGLAAFIFMISELDFNFHLEWAPDGMG